MILNWLIEGYARRQARTGTRFDGERAIAEKEDMWSAYGTSIDRFVATCISTDDATDDDAIAKKDAYAVYKTMCNDVGLSVESQQKLTAELKKEEGVGDSKRTIEAHFDDASRPLVFTGIQWSDDGETYLQQAINGRQQAAAKSETDDGQTGLDGDSWETAPSETAHNLNIGTRTDTYLADECSRFDMGEALTSLSAAKIAQQVKSGHLSPVDVVQAHLTRIHERNDRTNAFITVTDELAIEMAREAERAVGNDESLGPLHGVPVAIKDLDNVKGVPTTAGSRLFEDRIADHDSPVVERLKDAGAIILGKTNTPELGLGTTTDNPIIGPTSTPFNPRLVSGGSSGGSGAALGDSLVPLATGSDVGGSIRIPASLCGVYGFKPTYGLVPNVDRPNSFATHTPFAHEGPMARTVEDAAIFLDVISGFHSRDPFSVPTQNEYSAAVGQPIDDMKIAYSPDLGTYPVNPAVRDVLNTAVTVFERAGATVDRVDPDLGHSQEEIMSAYYTMVNVRWQSLFDNLELQGFDPRGKDRDRIRPYLIDLVMNTESLSAKEYKKSDIVRTRIFDGIQDVFDEYDMLVSATLGTTAFPHNEEPKEIDGKSIEPLRGWVLTQPYNFTGHPAASIPAGFVNDLPVGMQLSGQRFADDDVFRASAIFEQYRPWHSRYPS